MNRMVGLPERREFASADRKAVRRPVRARTSNLVLSISRGTFRLRLNIARGVAPAEPVNGQDGDAQVQPADGLPALAVQDGAVRATTVAISPATLPPPRAVPAASGTADPVPALSGQNCTVVYTDVVGFADPQRTDKDRLVIRQATAIMTMTALGPLWESCSWADRGDGMLIVIPPGIPTAAVVSRLLSVLPSELTAHNTGHDPGAQVQMRVAVEVGPLVTDTIGVSGEAIILAARMLEVPALKRAIAQDVSPLGLIISAFVYDTAVRNSGDALGVADYVPVQVKVKNSRVAAWYRLAG